MFDKRTKKCKKIGHKIGNWKLRKIFNEDNRNYQLLYLPLSLTNDFLEYLVDVRREYKFDIIVNSPVNIQLNMANMNKLFKLENQVFVLNSINLKAVCYNPVSPQGYAFNDFDIREKLEEILGFKVFNVKGGSV